ncbi:hypothetical protein [Chromobacterium alticapitis]|uniref:Uncharacterized protein n=1 Tax=Chromobacterium alticapitis TaxID=2073169 RepID=A0A2S5DB58_9NEIS|nr:hypothetical protein [Chromobacterium alticapitis]POZ60231.1 hypothetical protein C2I19_19940 [Chromobacterium alticapitis]
MSDLQGKNQNIQVLRGLSSNRSLLSCSSDGKVVDLWSVDDSSGRQQWDIVLVSGYVDVYNIIISGGTTGGRKYLSCTEDGSKVDLWEVDDGSGRQRWNFVPLNSNIPSYFNIKVVGGVNSGRVYLSCTADGAKVDLWATDDGSGRQRWQRQ